MKSLQKAILKKMEEFNSILRMDSRSLFQGAKLGGETTSAESNNKMFNLKATTTVNKKKKSKMRKTKIAWTEDVWNPVTGCTKCTEECRHCYAEKFCNRHKGRGILKYANGFKLTIHSEEIEKVKQFRAGSLVFLPSMSDLFHEDVPDNFIEKVISACESRSDVTFQLLTKRAERMARFFESRSVPQNVWVGVTIGHSNPKCIERLGFLKQIDAPIRFISAEPLLADIASLVDLTGIDWVIVGGESGPGARPMKEEWAWNLKLACENAGAAFFFKQWGSIGADGIRRKKELNGCLLKGREYKEYPRTTRDVHQERQTNTLIQKEIS